MRSPKSTTGEWEGTEHLVVTGLLFALVIIVFAGPLKEHIRLIPQSFIGNPRSLPFEGDQITALVELVFYPNVVRKKATPFGGGIIAQINIVLVQSSSKDIPAEISGLKTVPG